MAFIALYSVFRIAFNISGIFLWFCLKFLSISFYLTTWKGKKHKNYNKTVVFSCALVYTYLAIYPEFFGYIRSESFVCSDRIDPNICTEGTIARKRRWIANMNGEMPEILLASGFFAVYTSEYSVLYFLLFYPYLNIKSFYLGRCELEKSHYYGRCRKRFPQF